MTQPRLEAVASCRRAIRTCWLVLTVSAALLGGCSQPGSPDQAPVGPSTVQPPAALTGAATQDLCDRFTITALSSDAVIDQGPGDARRRAAHQFGSPTLIEQLAGEGRDHHWPLLAQHHARVQVTTEPVTDDPHTGRGAHAAAGVIARRVATSPDGWQQPLPSVVVYCSLHRADDRWQVAAVAFADLGPTGATP